MSNKIYRNHKKCLAHVHEVLRKGHYVIGQDVAHKPLTYDFLFVSYNLQFAFYIKIHNYTLKFVKLFF